MEESKKNKGFCVYEASPSLRRQNQGLLPLHPAIRQINVLYRRIITKGVT